MWYIPVLLFFLACLGIIHHQNKYTIVLLICQHREPSPVFPPVFPLSHFLIFKIILERQGDGSIVSLCVK